VDDVSQYLKMGCFVPRVAAEVSKYCNGIQCGQFVLLQTLQGFVYSLIFSNCRFCPQFFFCSSVDLRTNSD